MTYRCSPEELRAHEKTLAKGVVEVATELRMVDASELVALIRNDEQANISDIVNSSSELFFKPGALKYGLIADYELVWSAAPSIVLDMEFAYAPVSAFFKLTLARSTAGVHVLEIGFAESVNSHDARDEMLKKAIAQARRPCASAHRPPQSEAKIYRA